MNDSSEQFFTLNPQLFKVVMIYDDDVTRERTMRVCDYLVKLMWQDAELKFHWWRTAFFRDDGLARIAAQNATDSDFLILCTTNDSVVSPELEGWFESWIDHRKSHEGALVNLVTPAANDSGVTYRDRFLAEVSRRAKFDLMNVTIYDRQKPLQISIDITNPVHQTHTYSHFGLNE